MEEDVEPATPTNSANDPLLSRKAAHILASVITVAWGVSFLVDIMVEKYDPPSSVHVLMMIVAGATFGEGLVRSRG